MAQDLVAEAGVRVASPGNWGIELVSRCGKLQPWPEVGDMLARLREQVKVGVAANFSEFMGQQAAADEFDVEVTAARAGFCKPHGQSY